MNVVGFPALGAGNVRRSRQVAADWSLWDKSVEDVARDWVGVTGPTGGVADQLYLVQGGCGVELGDGLISNPPVQGRLAPSPWVVAVVMDLCAFRRLVACLTGGLWFTNTQTQRFSYLAVDLHDRGGGF